MINETNKNFLDEFKKLEKNLKKVTGLVGDNIKFRDLIDSAKKKHFLISKREGIIHDLYGLRNVLAHSDRDKYIAKINEIAFKEIQEINTLLIHPPSIESFVHKNIFTCSTQDTLNAVLEKMVEKIYTHIPVYDQEKRFYGMITETAIVNYLLKNTNINIYDTVDSIPKKFLNDYGNNNYYKFVSAQKSIFDVIYEFDKAIQERVRLGALFVTKTGKKDEKILGVVTAQDLPLFKEKI